MLALSQGCERELRGTATDMELVVHGAYAATSVLRSACGALAGDDPAQDEELAAFTPWLAPVEGTREAL